PCTAPTVYGSLAPGRGSRPMTTPHCVGRSTSFSAWTASRHFPRLGRAQTRCVPPSSASSDRDRWNGYRGEAHAGAKRGGGCAARAREFWYLAIGTAAGLGVVLLTYFFLERRVWWSAARRRRWVAFVYGAVATALILELFLP